ncbi:MAG: hypothetical protein IKW98_03670 [Prevotella sp.]|nr:hypothetical protein [Prevotella sp.]
MTPEELFQKVRDARTAAKALQQKQKTETNPVVKKQLAKQINNLFIEARQWEEQARLERCIEREFITLGLD